MYTNKDLTQTKIPFFFPQKMNDRKVKQVLSGRLASVGVVEEDIRKG
jgi:hypothetical protein